ncbi:MAG: M17 family peptidase N-terminal domain-containing protein, partial [Blastocatellia bacterium]
MESLGISENFIEANADALAVVVFKNEKAASGVLKELDKLTGGHIAAAIKSEEFKGETGETVLFRLTPKGKMKAGRLLLVGVGDKADYKGHSVEAASGTATR